MEEPLPDRAAILRAAIGIGLYAAAFGASFGAISVGSGLSLAQTMVLSLVMFTGASQFAFVGVAPRAARPLQRSRPACCLGYAMRSTACLFRRSCTLRGFARFWTAHFVIDETTAMAVSQATPSCPALCLLGHRADPVLPLAAGQPVRCARRPRDQPKRCWARCCRTCRFPGPALALAAAPGRALGGSGRRSCGPRSGTSDTARCPGCRRRQRRAGCWPTPDSERHRRSRIHARRDPTVAGTGHRGSRIVLAEARRHVAS